MQQVHDVGFDRGGGGYPRVMPLRTKLWDLTGGALLMRGGLAGRLTTVGRSSGQPRTVQCGFVRLPDGGIIVGSAEGRHWPQNLLAAGWCTFEAEGVPSARYTARRLAGPERAAAIEAVRAQRGARGTRMYSGLVFRLDPVPEAPSERP
jgi:deazaflavin-dependent oxidoreductase (nitroreductase family)